MSLHLHFDAFNGISGDMMLGALVDLGVPLESLKSGLSRLPIGEFNLRAETLKRSGIVGTRVHVEVVEDPHPHAHLRHVVEKVRAAGLPETVTARAIAAYQLLAEAEAHVHGSTPEKIHFHEVGANDAIVDIAGAMLGIHLLGVDSFSAEPVVLGSGSVRCAHGVMPVPAPATAEILKGFPARPTDIVGEMTTPTGAAILQVLTAGRAMPAGFRAGTIGYGAGSREIPGHPNYLRLILGRAAASVLPVDIETIAEMQAELDDMSPEVAGWLAERLRAEGALDAHLTPVIMKKGRPGFRLTVLCAPEDRERLAEQVLRESTTFGLRVGFTERYRLQRRMDTVETPWGAVAVKLGLWDGRVLKAAPEFEDCRALAERAGEPLRAIFSAAEAAIAERYFAAGQAAPGRDISE
jgi:pyridinium-3,5-bisthiocarboxylic acid mononucleotide nickel chelatase